MVKTTIARSKSRAKARTLPRVARAKQPEKADPHRVSKAFEVMSGAAVEYIDGAIVDILDSWSMRNSKPDSECLMSALASLRAARDELQPRQEHLANRANRGVS